MKRHAIPHRAIAPEAMGGQAALLLTPSKDASPSSPLTTASTAHMLVHIHPRRLSPKPRPLALVVAPRVFIGTPRGGGEGCGGASSGREDQGTDI
mmetsp:Transcript_10598/g.32587  ORF Transcript_10598/g.32587 Transcript_10598/m.32587 type:complete len:95 (-) Transcript_10598:387-671(-)